MRASIFFFAFALFALVSAQTTQRFLLDDFNINQGQNITIILPAAITSSNPRVIQGNTFYRANCGTGLIGCGRNMRIEVIAGEIQRQFTSQIFPSNTFNFTGEWDISNPKGGSSISYNLYQGNSADFVNVNPQGLGGVDFTEGGLAIGLRFALISDLASTFSVDVYDVAGGQSTGTAQFNSLPGQTYTQDQITDDIQFSSFTGNCDFTRVGAVEIAIPSQDAVDAIVYQIRGVGFPNPSASASPSVPASQSNSNTPSSAASVSPSNTPGPSQSNTPAASQSNTPSNTPGPSQSRTPAPSQSNTPAASSTPSATPSNSGPCIIFCQCPSFTCVILYETSLNGFNDIDFDFVPGDSVMTSDDEDSTVFVTQSNGSNGNNGNSNNGNNGNNGNSGNSPNSNSNNSPNSNSNNNNNSDAASLVVSFAAIVAALLI